MAPRERGLAWISAACFLLVAVLIALVLPAERDTDGVLIAGLIAGYAMASRVRFEFGTGYVVPEQLLFVPVLLLVPLPYVPAIVAAAGVVAMVPDFVDRSWHPDRWTACLADSWFSIGPVLVMAALAPGAPSLAHVDVYLLAFAVQFACDLTWVTLRDRIADGLSFRETFRAFSGSVRFEAMLTPVALVISLSAAGEPFVLLAIAPLIALLEILSRDRSERFAATIELHRAYRGTVMLLSDVVEHEDAYTASHSRSVVDLAHAVADELGVGPRDREELEFAALLHDVGKIAIPKEILNKPAKLTAEEFELIKTHTIEGHAMLERVGGLLARVGAIVRCCHERWDGLGYPDGLAGEEIPLAARIVFCCDAYNAMTTDRPYRLAMPQEDALEELVRGADTQFDARVVAAVVRVVEQGEPAVAASDQIRAILAGQSAHGYAAEALT